MGFADVNEGLCDDALEFLRGAALGGLDLFEADADGLRVDGGVFFGFRVLGPVELLVERVDFFEDRPKIFEVFLVDLQLEEEFREERAEDVFALPEFREDLLLFGFTLGVQVFVPRFGRAGFGMLRAFD